MIRFEGVKKAFDNHIVVNDLNFEIKKGESFCLLGKSGSGKTTTLKMINKLVEKDSGSILINDQSIDAIEENSLRRRIGYMIQDVGLFPHLTVEKNIGLPLKLGKKEKEEINSRVQELIDQIGLDQSYLSRFPSQLSGGQQQRVGIARAIANKPELLLMDEPFSALDPILRDQMQSDFLHIEELKGITKVIVTHDINEALRLADRICILHDGEILFIGTKEELLNSTNSIVNDFLGTDRLFMRFKNLTIEAITKNLYSETEAISDILELEATSSAITLLNTDIPFVRIKGNKEVFKKDDIILNALKDQI
ncbi:MAG: ATP-binding cassette domain-containing protein [bacterium]|nr:ATP-binding cassette domain-containing protein [bacterium]